MIQGLFIVSIASFKLHTQFQSFVIQFNWASALLHIPFILILAMNSLSLIRQVKSMRILAEGYKFLPAVYLMTFLHEKVFFSDSEVNQEEN